MKIVRYFLVGGVAAMVDVGLFSVVVTFAHLPWLPVSIATFLLATLVNYYLCVSYVFESGARFAKHEEVLLVFAISGLALLVNQACLFVLIEKMRVSPVLSKITATGVVFFWNYVGRNTIVFRKGESRDERKSI